jgi:hypothetical protein
MTIIIKLTYSALYIYIRRMVYKLESAESQIIQLD